jgi:beta-glucosidase-like glycosyl hydrolase
LGVAALLTSAALPGLTPQQKAALVVVSGLPSPPGVAGVIVRHWDRTLPTPAGALVVTDQEGGSAQTFPKLPTRRAATAVRNRTDAYASGQATGLALRRAGVDVDLAPVLELPDGPLGSRQFRSPLLGVAFARGLLASGLGTCVKHFPGLGSLPFSTDDRPYVRGRLRDADLGPYRAAIAENVPCIMVGHGVYPSLGPRRAVLEPATYRLLRRLGFRGVAMTDSLDVMTDTRTSGRGRRSSQARTSSSSPAAPTRLVRFAHSCRSLGQAGWMPTCGACCGCGQLLTDESIRLR